MTKSEFINKATRGPVSIGNGQYYIAKKINTDNFKIYSEDERLLYESRKYNQTYIGFVTRNKSKVHKLTKTKAYDRNGNLVIERLNNSLIETIKVDLANLELDLLSRASKVNY